MSPTRTPSFRPLAVVRLRTCVCRGAAALVLLALSLPAQDGSATSQVLELILGEGDGAVRAQSELLLGRGSEGLRWRPPLPVANGSLRGGLSGAEQAPATLGEDGSLRLAQLARGAAAGARLSLRWRAVARSESGGYSLRVRAGAGGLRLKVRGEGAPTVVGGGSARALHVLGVSGIRVRPLSEDGSWTQLALPMGDSWLVWHELAPEASVGTPQAVTLLREGDAYGGSWATLWSLGQREKSWPLDLRVVIDASASGGDARRAELAEAVAELMGALGPQDRIGVLVGAQRWSWWLPLGTVPGEAAVARWRERSRGLARAGATDLGRMFDALEAAEAEHVPSGHRRPVLIALGDGEATLGTVRRAALLARARAWQPQRGAWGVLSDGQPAAWLQVALSERGLSAVSPNEPSPVGQGPGQESKLSAQLTRLIAGARSQQAFERRTEILGVRSESRSRVPNERLQAGRSGSELGRWRGLAPASVRWKARLPTGEWSARAPVAVAVEDGLSAWMEREALRRGESASTRPQRLRYALPGPLLARAMAPSMQGGQRGAEGERLAARLEWWRTLLAEQGPSAGAAKAGPPAERVGLCFLAGRYWLLDGMGWLDTALVPLVGTGGDVVSEVMPRLRWGAARPPELVSGLLAAEGARGGQDLRGALAALLEVAPCVAMPTPPIGLDSGVESGAANPRRVVIFGR